MTFEARSQLLWLRDADWNYLWDRPKPNQKRNRARLNASQRCCISWFRIKAAQQTITASQIRSGTNAFEFGANASRWREAMSIAARGMGTKVLIDTFVQWFRLCVSGLIAPDGAGAIQMSP
jgi:hypothetical protein